MVKDGFLGRLNVIRHRGVTSPARTVSGYDQRGERNEEASGPQSPRWSFGHIHLCHLWRSTRIWRAEAVRKQDLEGSHLQELPAPATEETMNTNTWQPIETAPKDGTRILVWFEQFVIGQRVDIFHYAWSDHRWYGDGGLGYGLNPSHWIPLPNPPHQAVIQVKKKASRKR